MAQGGGDKVQVKPGIYFKDRKHAEVLYPSEFSAKHPWEQDPETPPREDLERLWDVGKEFISIPIINLSHITHNGEATSIMEGQGYYTFKPARKMGKILGKYDGSPVGETYRKNGPDQYQYIPRDGPDPVFPGYLSWWGINTETWYKTDPRGKEVRRIVQELKQNKIEVPGYLQSPASSRYGNHAFVGSLKSLITCYKQSRRDCVVKDCYFKKAGTLRYKQEICYVVIVCMEKDLKKERQLKNMPDADDDEEEGSIFERKEYINSKGKTVQNFLHFNTKYIQKKSESHSWENLAFAFYFPKEGQCLRCPVDMIVHDPNVIHSFCTSRKPKPGPPDQWVDFVCPNEL